MNRGVLPLLVGLLAMSAAAQELPRVEASEPRAFGYHVGDVVARRITLHLPAGWKLDDAALPRPGGHGQAIELRSVERSDEREGGGRRVSFDLEYQVLLSPAAVRTLEIAPLRLQVEGAGRSEELRVEAAPVTVGPLVPVDVSPRHGLGELQPDRAPLLIDDAALRWRLALWGLLAALIGLGLFVLHVGLPWSAARRRPFGLAWRALRRLGPDPQPDAWRAACRSLHAALDRSAGEVLFESGLPHFLAAQPRFAALGDEIACFIALSRREFFGGGAREAGDAAWLVTLARRLRDAERGGA